MGLLTTLDITGQHVLIVGSSKIIQRRRAIVEQCGGIPIIQTTATAADVISLGRPEVDNIVDLVFVGIRKSSQELDMAKELFDVCQRKRVPINVADHPNWCTMSLPSLYQNGIFQLGISTGGMGCRLANRIKRIVISSLPPNIGDICKNIGQMRLSLGLESECVPQGIYEQDSNDDDAEQTIGLNELVKEEADTRPLTLKRLRWLSQMVEYYPLPKLGEITIQDLSDIVPNAGDDSSISLPSSKGHISLVGAGPGRAGLLTTEALGEIKSADFVLTDKLVPQEVLDLIPHATPIFIARKFPGNAEKAQQELLEKGLEAVKEGKHVVRLKQGDPYIYGRGAEEYLYFEKHSVNVKVIPGVTSALAAPLLAGIPATHRGYADQILICTGTGREGALPNAPEWVESRTTIFLMALHRIKEVSKVLIDAGWDPKVPCASIERAACPGQRIVRSTLDTIAAALEELGSRPPGLLVVGRACEVIAKNHEKWTVEE